MIGIVCTVLLQSSSTTTSVVVTLVASGLDVRHAVFVIFGSNLGTSVTSTLTSMAHVKQANEFRAAFSGSVVHDMFNLLCVFVFAPIEITTNMLTAMTGAMLTDLKKGGAKFESVKAIIAPFTNLIAKIDSDAIKKGKADEGRLLTGGMFINSGWSDSAVGTFVFFFALIMMIVSLILIVRVLKKSLGKRVSAVIKKAISKNGYVAILLGAAMTILVQSSSITTSALVPLVGLGVVTLDDIFPVTLGSNIGTTATALLASLTTGSVPAVQIALCHLFFNVFGVLIFYPLPPMRKVPLWLATQLGIAGARYRWFAPFYLVFTFVLFPVTIFGLTFANPAFMITFFVLFVILLVTGIVYWHLLQTNRPLLLRIAPFLSKWVSPEAPADAQGTLGDEELTDLRAASTRLEDDDV